MHPDAAPLWDDIMARVQAEHQRKLAGVSVVSRETCPVELTPFGRIRWFTHPALSGPVIHSLYQFELEIPAGSRSGRLAHQGGIVHFVVRGRGYTELDGSRHEWEPEDLICIPARVHGVTFQHVNMGEEDALLVAAMPNFDSALGPALGAHFEVLEPAPEWIAAMAVAHAGPVP